MRSIARGGLEVPPASPSVRLDLAHAVRAQLEALQQLEVGPAVLLNVGVTPACQVLGVNFAEHVAPGVRLPHHHRRFDTQRLQRSVRLGATTDDDGRRTYEQPERLLTRRALAQTFDQQLGPDAGEQHQQDGRAALQIMLQRIEPRWTAQRHLAQRRRLDRLPALPRNHTARLRATTTLEADDAKAREWKRGRLREGRIRG